MNRLALDAASSLPWLLQGLFFSPFPHICCFPPFLLSPNPQQQGYLARKRGGIRPCASACHIRWRLFIGLENAPPVPDLSLGGSWRVA